MERRHGPRLYSAFEPISHHKIVAFPQLGHERIELRKVVRVIGIAYNHEAPSCGPNAANQGCSVATFTNRYDARAKALRNLPGTIGRAIIGDQYLSADVRLRQIARCLFHARGDSFCLVQTGHEDCQFRMRSFGSHRIIRQTSRGYSSSLHMANTTGIPTTKLSVYHLGAHQSKSPPREDAFHA